jgi:hypothetical protein
VVVLDFTRAGGSASGGRASIAMDGGELVQQEREADALVTTLAVVALPLGAQPRRGCPGRLAGVCSLGAAVIRGADLAAGACGLRADTADPRDRLSARRGAAQRVQHHDLLDPLHSLV